MLNRREFLECVALLIAGTGLSQTAFSLSSEQKMYLASAPDYVDREISYFSPAERTAIAFLSALSSRPPVFVLEWGLKQIHFACLIVPTGAPPRSLVNALNNK